MQANHGPTPIPIPPIVDHPNHIGRLSREIRRSIKALKDRRIVITGKGGGGPTSTMEAAGAFFTLLTIEDNVYLQGGAVTGGEGVETVANILVKDDLGAMQGTVGQHLYLVCTGDGVVADGVLLPGWNLTTVSSGIGTTPDNTLPTATEETGKLCHVDLGIFGDDTFYPAGAGNIYISFCLGQYSVIRELPV